MAQHDLILDNGPGLAVRQDMNAALLALASVSAGPVEPAVIYSGQLWLDTSIAPNGQLRQRNLGNTAWIDVVLGASFYQRSNAVGTVSQVGGVPTGALIEKGSNANGTYTRWADGTQMCISPLVAEVVAITTAASLGGFRGGFPLWTFPAAFIALPMIAPVSRSNSHLLGAPPGLTNTTCSIGVWSMVSQASAGAAYQAMAVGRWF